MTGVADADTDSSSDDVTFSAQGSILPQVHLLLDVVVVVVIDFSTRLECEDNDDDPVVLPSGVLNIMFVLPSEKASKLTGP